MIAAGIGLLALPLAYAGLMGWLRGGWVGNEELGIRNEELGANQLNSSFFTPHSSLTFSVLIAARNEAEALPQLLRDLAAQALPAACFEVLIADDHSTDATAALVTAAAQETGLALRLVSLPAAQTGKKAALFAAFQAAKAPWLVCTDADCRVGPGWLAAYAAQLERAPQANFISGPVLLTGPATFLHLLVGLEFAGLVGVGGACISRQQPTMCNGANLAYRRSAFEAVGGFVDNAHVASGDDEFLLHKIHAAFPGTVHFLADEKAIVRTAAPRTLPTLLRQRVRWASKWRHYQSRAPRRLAVLVLGANVALAAGAGVGLAWPALWPWVLAAWVIKLGADAWFLSPVLAFFGQRKWLWGLLPLQVLYAPYALAVGAAGWRGGYEWKGRAVR
ncbi:glycosyltransferase [Hymenobacter sp. BT770]|uniref:glycosyltransferase n=1 Tax=Hymenobacter sp. BT770 TaxID=2886942 RepID=UPI001D103E26|nr:glycosyltransferase [Hymenobacter sp. BT770]MCC3154656.1 glycosyltransferase [Hymenobacter sp. BT770]MDO3416709.1 glycosyltransferase [Hymenobacter sp. BT770]